MDGLEECFYVGLFDCGTSGLVLRPCCISRWQNMQFSLICILIRQK